jgi:hypothetical protein
MRAHSTTQLETRATQRVVRVPGVTNGADDANGSLAGVLLFVCRTCHWAIYIGTPNTKIPIA